MTLRELYQSHPELIENLIISGQSIAQFTQYKDFGTYEMIDIIINNYDDIMLKYNSLNDDSIPLYEFFTGHLKVEIEKKYKKRCLK